MRLAGNIMVWLGMTCSFIAVEPMRQSGWWFLFFMAA
jgi:hypothetical protein